MFGLRIPIGPLVLHFEDFTPFQRTLSAAVGLDLRLVERPRFSLAARLRVDGHFEAGVAALLRLGRWGVFLDDGVLGSTWLETFSVDENLGVIAQISRRVAVQTEIRLVDVGDKGALIIGRDGVDLSYGLLASLSCHFDLRLSVGTGRENDRAFVGGSVALVLHMPESPISRWLSRRRDFDRCASPGTGSRRPSG
jgi:hypothetical protein